MTGGENAALIVGIVAMIAAAAVLYGSFAIRSDWGLHVAMASLLAFVGGLLAIAFAMAHAESRECGERGGVVVDFKCLDREVLR